MTTAKLPLALILVAAIATVTPACGTSKGGASHDDGGGAAGRGKAGGGGDAAGTGGAAGGGAGDQNQGEGANPCFGSPIACAQGGPSGTGVACGGLVTLAGCFEGHWECGNMVPQASCTCGEPGVSCPGAVCTPHGWVCPDGGTDADAGPDATTDAGCGGGPNPGCGQVVSVPGQLVICGDYIKYATCVSGQWTCEAGWVFAASCICDAFPPPGCNVCTTHGWVCPDGGVDSTVYDGPASGG